MEKIINSTFSSTCNEHCGLNESSCGSSNITDPESQSIVNVLESNNRIKKMKMRKNNDAMFIDLLDSDSDPDTPTNEKSKFPRKL